MVAFIIWLLVGIFFVGMGLYEVKAKKEEPIRFWVNIKEPSVKHVKEYNKAVGKLWVGFGIVFMILGIPLLAGQNSPYPLISGIGVIIEVAVLVIVYIFKIENKYKENK